MPRTPALRLLVAPLLSVALLAGCTTERAAADLPRHTLQVAETSYAGHLEPARSVKMALSVENLAVAQGTEVAAGTDLGGAGEASRARSTEVERVAAGYRDRIVVAERALRDLSRGKAVKHTRDASLPEASVRAVEHDIEAALLASRRAAVQRARDKAGAMDADPAVAKYSRQDEELARQEQVNQLQALFENLRAEARAALTVAEEELRTLRGAAPFDGVIAVRDGEVWVHSTQSTFVYTATEAQVEALSSADQLDLRVKGETVGTLRVASTIHDPEASTGPTSPRYAMRFDVVADPSFKPRDRSTASMTSSQGQLGIPEDYLGKDTDGYFVLRQGVRTPVEVGKDPQGQFVLTGGSLHAGDSIEKVAA